MTAGPSVSLAKISPDPGKGQLSPRLAVRGDASLVLLTVVLVALTGVVVWLTIKLLP